MPTSKSSSSCATTPATKRAARTTSTSPTGSPTCSCGASRPTATWSLFDPKIVPHFPICTARNSSAPTSQAEAAGQSSRQVKARDLYARMMRTLAQTGNGWMTFKDASNRSLQPDRAAGATSCICRICAPRSSKSPRDDETAVCNLGSINSRARHVETTTATFDFDKLARNRATRRAPARPRDRPQLLPDRDRAPFEHSLAAGRARRDGPAGRVLPAAPAVRLGRGARAVGEDPGRDLLRTRSMRRASWRANAARIRRSRTRARRRASCSSTCGASRPTTPTAGTRCARRSTTHGLRNSLLIAIAPTATIASIAGCYECIEPQVSNLFKRETLSGDFLQINRYLVKELKTARPVDRRDPQQDQAQPKARSRTSQRFPMSCKRSIAPRGNADAFADRHGGRPRRVHRPERSR